MDNDWQAWLDQAEEDLRIAELLLSQGFYAGAVFHAGMAFELAAKAVHLRPLSVGELDLTIGELHGPVVGDLGGLSAKTGHVPMDQLVKPWHPLEAGGAATKVFADIEASLGLRANSLYEAVRYPDRWSTRGAPYRKITKEHAMRAVTATFAFIQACRPMATNG